jgi:hypothetical protein
MTDKKGGASLPVMESYTNLRAGTQAIGVAAIRIATGLGVTSFTCIIQAAHGNAGRIFVGNAAGQYFELDAGEAVSIPTDINNVFVRASIANQTVRWLAGG